MKNFCFKIIICLLLISSLSGSLFAQTDSTAALKTIKRRVVEFVFGEHPKEITRGIQHTAMWQASSGVGASYDLRTRTANRYFDWAAQVGVGYDKYRYFSEYRSGLDYRPVTVTEGIIGVSALWGKRAFSLELGEQLSIEYRLREKVDFIDYKTQQETFAQSRTTNVYIGLPFGFRFQPVTGGLFVTLTPIPRVNIISSNSEAGNFRWSGRLGLGYTFRTKARGNS